MKQFITVSVPGKLMILGEHAVVYGYPCIVSTIDKHLTMKGRINDDNTDAIITGKMKDTRFIQAALNVVRHKYKLKEKLYLMTETKLGRYGLGSSSAVTVATVALFDQLFGLSLTKKELFNLSYKAVRQVQKKTSGFDIASCIFGGTIYFDGESKSSERISAELLPVVVGFSGKKADTSKMVEEVSRLRGTKPKEIYKIFKKISQIVDRGRTVIEKKDWPVLGDLMNKNHQLLVEMGVSTDKLDNLVKSSLEKGAYGAKLSGAGGGDCMIALVSDQNRQKVKEAIINAGGKLLDLKVGSNKKEAT